MIRYLLMCVGLILSLGSKSQEESFITIVDIGHLDRVGIAKELSIINRYSPRVIGLDFHLLSDSLDKDMALLDEISSSKNLVQVSSLYDFIEPLNYWDSITMPHPKFRREKLGFSNLTRTDDSVFIPELPMRQFYREKVVHAFSYVVAANSFGVAPEYLGNGVSDFYFDISSIGAHFKIISVSDLLQKNFDENDLNDKIVLMGYVGEDEDWLFLDDERTKKINGVEIHASIISEILDYR